MDAEAGLVISALEVELSIARSRVAELKAGRDRVVAAIATIEAELQTERVRAVRGTKQHVRARLEGAREALAALDATGQVDDPNPED